MYKFVKRWFDRLVLRLWVREILGACSRCRKSRAKLDREWYVLKRLIEAFNEKYNGNLPCGGGEASDD